MNDDLIEELVNIMKENSEVVNCSELEMRERAVKATEFLESLRDDK